jgi:hypothetical protein
MEALGALPGVPSDSANVAPRRMPQPIVTVYSTRAPGTPVRRSPGPRLRLRLARGSIRYRRDPFFVLEVCLIVW